MNRDVEWKSVGKLRFGVAKTTLPMPDGISMAGFGWASRRGRRANDTLSCRALFLEDASGRRVALAVVDLMAISSAVLDAVSERLSGEFSRSEIILTATHTHAAPGHYFGDRFYGGFAQGLNRRSFAYQTEWVAVLVDAIVSAIRGARSHASHGSFGVGQVSLFGVAHNRSVSAFEANPEVCDWWKEGGPGNGAPAALPLDAKAIDPRVTVLCGIPDSPERSSVCFGFFGCHANSLGPKNDTYHRDWPGYATDAIETALPGTLGAIGQTSAGDASPIPGGQDAATAQGLSLAMEVGRLVGEAAAAVYHAMPRVGLEELELTVARGELTPARTARWAVGWPVILGAAEGRTKFVDWFLHEGMTDKADPTDSTREQWPKAEAFRWLRPLLDRFRIAPSRSSSVHVLRIGSHLFGTCPGEISCVGAHRLERAMLDASEGMTSATILGYGGGYIGYITTPEEYAMQRYEGAHTLFGSGTLDGLTDAILRHLPDSETPPTSESQVLAPVVADEDLVGIGLLSTS